jgi:2-methylisocitrate lyase-like PEP mutase family enzyme
MVMTDPSSASTFRDLHREGALLVLPNAWDAATARLVEACGAAAIATSSAAVSWAHGFADGEKLDPATLVRVVAEIVRVVRVPVSVDAEAGYAARPEDIAESLAALIDAGAVGVNLEDGAAPPEALAAKIAVAKRVAARAGVDLFVNARTDVYLRGLVAAPGAVDETLRRARLYREAGCDGLFVPGLAARAEVETVVREARLPLNLMVVSGLAPAAELRGWGVRRLSAGSGLAQATLGFVRRATTELLEHGTYAALSADAVTYGEMNTLFTTRK